MVIPQISNLMRTVRFCYLAQLKNPKGTKMIRTKFSRGPDVDTNKCVEMIGNRYDLILVAAIRSREIARQHRHSEAKHHIYPGVTALLEIQNGEIGPDYLKRIR